MNPNDPSGPVPWKGLDTSQMPVFLGYDQIERMVAALLDRARSWAPDDVVGIVRGGVVPAMMAAGILALPLSFIRHDASSGTIDWVGPPASGRKILLVDDCCSTGTTLRRARTALSEAGYDCLTLVVVHDPEVARFLPDLSHPMRELFRLPWERGEATPTGRAAKAAGDRYAPAAAEAPFFGIALDAKLLADISVGRDRDLPNDRAVLISVSPDDVHERFANQLAATRFRGLPLEFAALPASPARFKAETATRYGCTHFIDGDAEQAIQVAAHAPHLIVTWRSARDGKSWIIGAAPRPAV